MAIKMVVLRIFELSQGKLKTFAGKPPKILKRSPWEGCPNPSIRSPTRNGRRGFEMTTKIAVLGIFEVPRGKLKTLAGKPPKT